jgi:hypothetical protein
LFYGCELIYLDSASSLQAFRGFFRDLTTREVPAARGAGREDRGPVRAQGERIVALGETLAVRIFGYRGAVELYARLGTPGDENGVDVGAWRGYYGSVEERRVVSLTGISVMETGLADV